MEISRYIILTDQQLVTLSIDGDSEAFETLFNRYRDSIYKLYVQRTGNSDDAKDLLQETFVKVFLNLARYNTTYTFGQWIYTIARNTFIDFIRRRREDISYDISPVSGSTIAAVATEATPEQNIINLQQKMQLDSYLQRMTPRYRTLIELRFFRSLNEEIASELNCRLVRNQITPREQLCAFHQTI